VNPSLITLSGKAKGNELKVNPLNLDDYSAGIYFLRYLALVSPGSTLKDIAAASRTAHPKKDMRVKMAGWDIWGGIKSVTNDVVDGVGDVFNDVGHGVGNVWRSFEDTDAAKLANAGVAKMVGIEGEDYQMSALIEKIGAAGKSRIAGVPVWAFAGVGVLMLTMMLVMKKKKYD